MTKSNNISETYLTRSARAVFLWTFFTGGLYMLYWSYRHWKEIGERERRKTYPVLGALFLFFTIFNLLLNFERMYVRENVKLYPMILALLYVGVSLGNYALAQLPTGPLYVLLMLVGVTIVAGVAGFAQKKVKESVGTAEKQKRYAAPEIVWIVLGMVLFIPSVIFATVPQSYYDSLESSLKTWAEEQERRLEQTESQLEERL